MCVPAAPPDGAACNRSADEAKTRERFETHSCTLISSAHRNKGGNTHSEQLPWF